MSPCEPHCRFSEDEAASIHELAQILKNGGNDNIRYLISVAKTMQMAHKVAWGAAITLLVGGFLKALYEGVKLMFIKP
jgi:hypothetical protein